MDWEVANSRSRRIALVNWIFIKMALIESLLISGLATRKIFGKRLKVAKGQGAAGHPGYSGS